MPRYDSQMQFAKVAKVEPRCLRNVHALLTHRDAADAEQGADTRHLRSAIYLAGYCVECILKTYIIAKVPRAQTLSQAIEHLRERGKEVPNLLSAEGHNLYLLMALIGLEPILETNQTLNDDWHRCRIWQSVWHYDPQPPTRKFATDYVEATERFYKWVLSRICSGYREHRWQYKHMTMKS